MSEGRQYKRWILLDRGSLHIKESVEHPGHGWVDLSTLLERIAELEAENERLREDNERMTRLYYQPQAQEIMHELVQAQRENERLKSEAHKRDAR